ncbi:MAG: hypothetical protein ACRCXT_16800 [Paraclostridium sp.]
MTEIGKSLIEEAKREKAIEIARNLLEVLTIEMIANKTGLTVEEVKSLKDESK